MQKIGYLLGLAAAVCGPVSASSADAALGDRLKRTTLSKSYLDQIDKAVQRFRAEKLEPLPGFPFDTNLAAQERDFSGGRRAAILKDASLTSAQYVNGVWAIIYFCDFRSERVIALNRANTAVCDANRDQIRRILYSKTSS